MLSTPAATADGNNGTLKILNAASGAEFRDNEPKVCSFKYEGFGFDAAQTGAVVVAGQGQTTYGPVTVAAVTANGDGYFVTRVQYLQSGHYKAEFQSADQDAAKFKSKVFKVDCEQPAPIQVATSQTDMSCELGYGTRAGTITQEYVWTSTGWQLEPESGWTTVWAEWTYRDLTEAEFEELGCRPDQPDAVVAPLSDERSGCDNGVEQREGTQTTTYVWNADTRTYDPVVGTEVWGEWVTVRDLTADEAIALGCIAGEETVVPTPTKEPAQTPKPTVLGTEAAVPTQVDAGAAGLPDAGTSTSGPLALLMVGGGLLLLAAGGWLGLGGRAHGVHLA